MLSLMSVFLEKCDAKFRELVTSRPAGPDEVPSMDASFVAISSVFVAHPSLRDLLMQHSMLSGAEDADSDLMLVEKESILMEKLKNDRSLHRGEIIFDPRLLRSIILLQRSLVTIR